MSTSLPQLLSKSLAKFYVLSSDEDSYPLVNFANSLIKSKLPIDCVRYNFTADRYFKFDVILNALNNGSLFATHNIFEINYKTKPVVDQQAQLIAMLSILQDSDTVIITTGKLDKKDLSSKWIQEVVNSGGVICNLNQDDISTVLHIKLKQTKLELDSTAKEMLLNMNHGNSLQLLSDIDKLSYIYPENSKLTTADLEKHLLDNAMYSIFQLSPAYLSGDLNRAIMIFNNVYQVAGDAVLICWVIVEDLRKLLKLKGLIKQGDTEQQALRILRLWGDAVHAIPLAHTRLGYNILLALLDEMANIDLMIKGVLLGDLRLKFLQIITKLCNKK